jgi:hypothetical protein
VLTVEPNVKSVDGWTECEECWQLNRMWRVLTVEPNVKSVDGWTECEECWQLNQVLTVEPSVDSVAYAEHSKQISL